MDYMPSDEPTADEAEPASEVEDTESQEGYEIALHVTPEGYRVSGPLPLSAEPQTETGGNEDENSGEVYPDLTTALKHVIAITKEHPISHDAAEQFRNASTPNG